MRRILLLCLAGTFLSTAGAPVSAQQLPPHAWLFGTWTGGVFPPPQNMSREACLSQPVVIFTRDLVLRATLTEQELTQRVIESARATPTGMEFRFASPTDMTSPTGILGSRTPQPTGFGCDTSNVLHVQRRGENEITFPGCADFPNPLVRCR